MNSIFKTPKSTEQLTISMIQQRIGSPYKEDSFLRKGRFIETIFDACAQQIGSKWLWLPIMSPSDTYIGQSFRPLQEKLASRVLTNALPDGWAVAIRYEGTAPTARFAAEKMAGDLDSLRYHYMQPMVRIEESYELDDRHYREFTQLGIELFTKNPEQRIENIAAMAEMNISFFQQLNLEPVFRVSHTGLINGFLQELGLNNFVIRQIAAAMENKPLMDIESLLQTCGVPIEQHKTILKLAEARGTPLLGASKLLAQLKINSVVCSEFEALVKALTLRGIIDVCQLDAGIYRSLNFYNGFTVQLDAGGIREVLGAGEYSLMMNSFGAPNVFSCGSAIGLERIMDLVSENFEGEPK